MNDVTSPAQEQKFNLGGMRFMYAITSIGALPLGLLMCISPELLTSWLGWVFNEPLFPGAYGGCLIAFGILCGLGFRSPVKFAPVLFFQFVYKSSWALLVWVPLWLNGELPEYHLAYTIGMMGAIVIDLFVVPFGYFFKKERI